MSVRVASKSQIGITRGRSKRRGSSKGASVQSQIAVHLFGSCWNAELYKGGHSEDEKSHDLIGMNKSSCWRLLFLTVGLHQAFRF